MALGGAKRPHHSMRMLQTYYKLAACTNINVCVRDLGREHDIIKGFFLESPVLGTYYLTRYLGRRCSYNSVSFKPKPSYS